MRFRYVTLALFLLILSAGHAYAQASFTRLGSLPGGSHSRALGLSPDGSTVVGWAADAAGTRYAVYWSDVDVFDTGIVGELRGASEGGEILAGSRALTASVSQAFRILDGQTQFLSVVPYNVFGTHLYGLSWDGAVASGTAQAPGATYPFRAVDWVFEPLLEQGEGYGVSGDGQYVVGARAVAGGQEAIRWTGSEVESLGDLPGGPVSAAAYAANFDGSVVVGYSVTGSGIEAFRWEDREMENLGGLPGAVATYALGVSEDGSAVVGTSNMGTASEAFLWTESLGMISLTELLESGYGVDVPDELRLTQASAISRNTAVIVGIAVGEDGREEAFRVDLLPRPPVITYPTEGAQLFSGVDQTIRWQGGTATTLDIFLRLDNGDTHLLASGIDAEAGEYDIRLFQNLFCTRCQIVLYPSDGGAYESASGHFRVRGTWLARVNEAGEYELFHPNRHGLRYGNTRENWFPPEWWQRFDYQGIDPFSDLPYDPYTFVRPEPAMRPRSDGFPDWPSFVNAFGTDDAYVRLQPRKEALYAYYFWKFWHTFNSKEEWGGSCYGMAAVALATFHDPSFPSDWIGAQPYLYDYDADLNTAPALRELVNTLFQYQLGYHALVRAQIDSKGVGPVETYYEVLQMLLTDTAEDDAFLSMKDGSGRGGHAVLPYSAGVDVGDPNKVFILVYDPNLPGEENHFVHIDLTTNTWSYEPLGFSGTTGLYLGVPVSTFHTDASFEVSSLFKQEAADGIGVFAGGGATVEVTGAEGSTGYADGAAFSTIPGATPIILDVGGPTHPVGYHVPPGDYTIRLADAPDETVGVTIFDGATVYAYGRSDADAGQTDELAFGESGLRASNADETPREVALEVSAFGEEEGHTMMVNDLSLSAGAAVTAGTPDGEQLELVSEGAATPYELVLQRHGPDSTATYSYGEVPLEAGAHHTVRADWTRLDQDPVIVEIDRDGNGVVDETLRLAVTATAVEGPEQGPLGFALEAAYPNPASQSARITYSLPAPGRVRLALYDVQGRLVRPLAEGQQAAGVHTVEVATVGLPAGTYFYRLETRQGVRVRVLVVAH